MPIDRQSLVTRHNPVLRKFDPFSPLSVGNGEFAFTADITGLQTFPQAYQDGIPLCTMAQWGWHTAPASDTSFAFDAKDLRLKYYDTYGRRVGYATSPEGQDEAYHWLRKNPHRFHLGRIGLAVRLKDGSRAGLEDIMDIEQTLDLWRGILLSRFSVEGRTVAVRTCCHPRRDILAFSISSELLRTGSLGIELSFPYGSPEMTGADWGGEERHRTDLRECSPGCVDLQREMDRDRYFVRVAYSTGARIRRTGRHSFVIEGTDEREDLDCVCWFSPHSQREMPPSFAETAAASAEHWEGFWREGGAVDLGESADARAGELERRIVLSQYLTAIQCAGSLPPAETGLTCNSWYGKFHLEMHWWHAAHFPLWGRASMLERSLPWYRSILPVARGIAVAQGYQGARWPKMTGPDGADSPSPIGPLLIWQQPHPIYYAELCHRAHPSPETLAAYKEIVLETAAFMASYAVHDRDNNRYVLGPPLIPAQENHAPEIALNPPFELEYWAFGLALANEWRARLGLAGDPLWAEIAAGLGPLPAKDGVYLAHENCPETFTRFNYDHPSMLGALGILPGRLADRGIMLKTLERVLAGWEMDETWGWDFPMMAMTAARLDRPDLAVGALLLDTPKNTYLPNGHNRQGARKDLPLYLPGNGGLLAAVAMMAAGWDGCGSKETPGFPKDGTWKVSHEGLSRMP